MAKSRLEINFIRLLEETQLIANGNVTKDWKFEKFVQWLNEKISEMEKIPSAPETETLKHYKRQVDFLKRVLETDKAVQDPPCLIPHGTATTDGQVISQQIHQKTINKATTKLRQELLGLDKSEVRHRLVNSEEDELLFEEKRRDKMIDDMIAMTREWKEQSKVANKVIKKDTEVIDNSGKLADINEANLKVESNRLSEFNKRTCNCWIWLMLIFICCAFISMVMFIKMFRKKTYLLPTTPAPVTDSIT